MTILESEADDELKALSKAETEAVHAANIAADNRQREFYDGKTGKVRLSTPRI